MVLRRLGAGGAAAAAVRVLQRRCFVASALEAQKKQAEVSGLTLQVGGAEPVAPNRDEMREFWDAYAQGYDDSYYGYWSGQGHAAVIDRVVKGLGVRGEPDSAGLLSGKRILDAGCGTGAVAVALARMGATVVALDASEQMVKAAAERATAAEAERRFAAQAEAAPAPAALDVEFLETELETARLPESSFDAVLAHDVLPYLATPAEQLAALSNLHSALKPYGTAVVSTFAHINLNPCLAIVYRMQSRLNPSLTGCYAYTTEQYEQAEGRRRQLAEDPQTAAAAAAAATDGEDAGCGVMDLASVNPVHAYGRGERLAAHLEAAGLSHVAVAKEKVVTTLAECDLRSLALRTQFGNLEEEIAPGVPAPSQELLESLFEQGLTTFASGKSRLRPTRLPLWCTFNVATATKVGIH